MTRSQPPEVLPVTLTVIVAGLVAGCVGQAALAVSVYESGTARDRCYCSSALGRVGSIVDAAVAPAGVTILTTARFCYGSLSFGRPAREDRKTWS